MKIHALDPRFPPQLRFTHGPLELEAEGPLAERLAHLGPSVAIVGTRNAPPEAFRYAYWLAATLARAGATILSGGARGIDTAAHAGALSVEGRTVVLLPSGLRRFTPARNAALFRKVRKEGALVAFLDDRQRPAFHLRNAALAALADHVVVVAAGLESGARITANDARRFDKPLWVVPGAPWEPRMQGCLLELLAGRAQPLLSPRSIAKALGLDRSDMPEPHSMMMDQPWTHAPYELDLEDTIASGRLPELDLGSVVTDRARPASSSTVAKRAGTVESILPAPDERRLIEALREAPGTVDGLVLRTGLPVGPVRALLLTWTVEGVVREGPPGLFQLAST